MNRISYLASLAQAFVVVIASSSTAFAVEPDRKNRVEQRELKDSCQDAASGLLLPAVQANSSAPRKMAPEGTSGSASSKTTTGNGGNVILDNRLQEDGQADGRASSKGFTGNGENGRIECHQHNANQSSGKKPPKGSTGNGGNVTID